ncbi:MAG: catechol 2,3-dioxygenase-like lactoylglutathione lyase family enzyme [Halobacteriales archaeon]|jgi:catechol 2,3-dioxygenase-like lactoylglutathione lyase family enzyme
MDPRISIVTLGVRGLDESTAFYRDGLGRPQAETDGDIAFFGTAGPTLAPYPREAPAEDATVPPRETDFGA